MSAEQNNTIGLLFSLEHWIRLNIKIIILYMWKKENKKESEWKRGKKEKDNISYFNTNSWLAESSNLRERQALWGPRLSLEPLDWGDMKRMWKPYGILWGGPESCLFRGHMKVPPEKTSIWFQTWSHKAHSQRTKPASMVAHLFHTAVSSTKAD